MDNSTMPTHVCYFTQISNALFGCIIEEKAYNKKEVCSFRAGNASTLKNLPLYSDISMENPHFFIICCFHINVNWFLRKEVLSHVK